MKGYVTEYGYLGKMPNGRWREFLNRKEYEEAYLIALYGRD